MEVVAFLCNKGSDYLIHMKVIGTPLFQWESGRRLQIIPLQNMRVDSVHFSNPEDSVALVVKPKEVDGMMIADIPNVLLQKGSNLVVYSVNVSSDCVETLRESVFSVRNRAKPSDYVYTETEVLSYSYLAKRIEDLEGEGLAKAVEAYLKENPVQAGATKEEAAQIEQNRTDIEQLNNNKLSKDELNTAIDSALTLAKASGEFDGENGEPGKTAYQYAKDGGYTGTESEFATKLAKECPTKVSELSNDSKFITASGAPVQSVNGKTGKVVLDAASVGARPSTWTPTASDVGALPANTVIPTVPTKVSAFTNDAGYLTEHQDLSGYAKTADIPKKPEDIGAQPSGNYLTEVPSGYATEEFVTNKIAEAELGGEEVDLSGYAQKSEIPTKVSQLQNDKGYLTEHQSLTEYAKKTDIPTVPTKVSQFQNDAGYLTEHQSLAGYATEQFVEDGYQPKGKYLTEVPEGYAKTADIPTKPEDINAQPAGNYALKTEIPTVPVKSVNGKTGAVSLSASDVGARPSTWMPSASDVGALPSNTKIPAKTSDLTNDSGFITGYTETDPTVPAWAKASSKPSYTASEVGALPNTTKIPSKTSDLTNDSGFLTDYTETDPTVPSWAKAASKPSYSKSEVGLGNVDNVKQYSASNPPPYPVTSVNGKTGAVTVDVPTVPTKVSAFTNDAGYITGYTETDPTVPSWAKAASKPSYTASEVGAVPTSRTVNGKKLSSNITLTASEIGAVSNESTLTLVGVDADGGTHTYTIYGKSAANEPD